MTFKNYFSVFRLYARASQPSHVFPPSGRSPSTQGWEGGSVLVPEKVPPGKWKAWD